MIWIAAIVEAGIENWIDMGILLFIQFANASIGYYEITKAGDAVAALKKSLKPVATVKRDGIFLFLIIHWDFISLDILSQASSGTLTPHTWCPETWCSWPLALRCLLTAE
jgi:hypothetical protein